jgi:Arc/MetJ-type ribon-helix-helix transcriptional regulator
MAKTRTVAVELTERQLADLDAAVDGGLHETTGAILREAVSDWQIRHALDEEDVRRLRELWDEGQAGGRARAFDVERILASARARRTSNAAE